MQYLGSSAIMTSTTNQEIVQTQLVAPYTSLGKFTFINDGVCHVLVNNSLPILLRANQGFYSEQSDYRISSFIIIDAGITFSWIGEISW